ncbi:hypothetical protein [Bacillus sp. PS06]|uniref:hypothetical protein n=1 Tax=Bacillus sp. PS06 TaxID=2764176 RepID=UPI00177DAC7F|nr:hypothetical protein [Bacillus sp. PS06]MBD8069579.1 hypothetical protein [Bacillus sp. PS06]
MRLIVALLVILLVVVTDYFWFDVDKKRWGWMKKWSRFSKALFAGGFVIVSVLIYVGLSAGNVL